MSVQYFGYSRMKDNLYDTFPFEEVQKSKEILKKYTATYTPRTKETNRFVYTGTEINQNKHQTPFLQRSLIEGLDIPIFEYYGRVKEASKTIIDLPTKENGRIENSGPPLDYVYGVDMTSNEYKLFKKEFI